MKSRKKVVVGVSGDRISGLPDALICHILSFLPTKEAASTTVLAKRWKPLLASVPNLDFDDSIYFHPRERIDKYSKSYESFMSFVDSVLALQAKTKTPLKRFHVKCKDVVDQYWVLEWIPKVLKRGALDIDLYIPSSRDCCENSSFYPLPSKIFESKTLVRLKIQFQDGVSIDVKRCVSLPKLKTLYLDYFKIEPSKFNKLLSGCHALEELVLINLMWADSSGYKACPVTVSIPTLKRLKFCRSEDFYEGEFHEYEDYDEENINKGVSLSFDNPNLVYLEYSDVIVDKYKQVRFDSLVEANLGLRKNQAEPDKINVTKLLMGLRNVKILYLSNDTLEVLACCRERIPVFDNLLELTIKTTPYVGWKSLPPLLKSCPSLETLVFEGLHHKYTKRCGDKDGCLCKYENDLGAKKKNVRTCLTSSPVKVLKILKFGETFEDEDEDGLDVDHDDYDDEDAVSCDEVGGVVEEQIEHVKHFLETMPVLKQVILYYNTPKDEDVMKVFKKLEKLPRVASANCNVQITSKNLSLSSTSTKRGTLL
ncbi:putative F-box/LRR-repeat protein [Arabidopsis thaliana]